MSGGGGGGATLLASFSNGSGPPNPVGANPLDSCTDTTADIPETGVIIISTNRRASTCVIPVSQLRALGASVVGGSTSGRRLAVRMKLFHSQAEQDVFFARSATYDLLMTATGGFIAASSLQVVGIP